MLGSGNSGGLDRQAGFRFRLDSAQRRGGVIAPWAKVTVATALGSPAMTARRSPAGEATDVLIVGAGIIGLASAYALLRAGATVRIVDRSLPGSGESTKTGGGIRLAHGSHTNVVLTQLSLPTWTGFEALTGIDPSYRQTGHLFLTSDDERAALLESQATWLASVGARSDLMTRDEIGRRWPHLGPMAFETGSYCETGGYLDHHRVIQGYVRAVEAEGGIVQVGTRVDEVLMDDDRVTGVGSPGARFTARHVVNAAGPNAGEIAALAGLRIPFVSRRHELLVARPQRPVPRETPWLIDIDDQVHLRPDGEGRALIGGFLGRDDPVDPSDYDRTLSDSWSQQVRHAAAGSFGIIEETCSIVDGWAGLYPGTQDYQPVLEITMPGLVTAAGFSGTGLMHAPAVGQIVADLVLTGSTSALDISDLRSTRFGERRTVVERTGF